MKIEILGIGCPKCKILAANAEAVVRRLGLDCELRKVTDISEIASYGVLSTPALVVDGKVKVAGKVASEAEIEALLRTEVKS